MTGGAYVFTRSGTTWTQQQLLVAPNETYGTEFGRSVSVSGGTAIIGAQGRNAFVFDVPGGVTTIASVPTGLGVTVDGVTVTTPAQFSWAVGSSHTVAAAPTVAGGSGTQYAFQSWSQGGSGTQTISGPATDTTYTASYQMQNLVSTAVSPVGAGSVNGGGWANAGATATLTASANSGYTFADWSGLAGGLSATNPLSLTVNGPLSVVANFTAQAPQLVGSIATHANSGGVETIAVGMQNVGPVAAGNVTITSIVATVASGSGTLGTVSPAAPQNVGAVGVGATVTSGAFTFACPATVARIKLVVNFTAAGGYSSSTTSTIFK
jgi:hypothetical protein